jgi:hypothetical protein
VVQGLLGDSYFLGVLAVLAERPGLIRNLFISDEVNEAGVFGVTMTKNGQKVDVLVDNYVPCNDEGDPCFASCNTPELWVILLEKAWAKLHGSYHRIDGG